MVYCFDTQTIFDFLSLKYITFTFFFLLSMIKIKHGAFFMVSSHASEIGLWFERLRGLLVVQVFLSFTLLRQQWISDSTFSVSLFDGIVFKRERSKENKNQENMKQQRKGTKNRDCKSETEEMLNKVKPHTALYQMPLNHFELYS